MLGLDNDEGLDFSDVFLFGSTFSFVEGEGLFDTGGGSREAGTLVTT